MSLILTIWTLNIPAIGYNHSKTKQIVNEALSCSSIEVTHCVIIDIMRPKCRLPQAPHASHLHMLNFKLNKVFVLSLRGCEEDSTQTITKEDEVT